MKCIVLKFYGLGLEHYAQASINIYDSCGRLIYSGDTYNGSISLFLDEDNCYKLEANSLGRYISVWFYVGKNDYCYKFNFDSTYNQNNIAFLLTDYYYGLPIQRGNLILWQR
ncbi:MAG: hypothetical protein E7160_04925 [Firmicutes bacterium]|nr:hypothetical protein [Bacillota bacterium]